jgi:hypothetical protein
MTMARICLLAVCIWAFAGCTAWKESTLNMPLYSPGQQLDSPIPETKSIVWETLQLNPTLLDKPKAVGVKKSALAGTGHIFLYPRMKEWLTEAAKIEFKGVGLEETLRSADNPNIFISVNQFFVEPGMGVTILDVSVTLPKKGKMFERRFVGEETEAEVIWNDSDFVDLLLRSARLAFHEAAQETRRLIDREDR